MNTVAAAGAAVSAARGLYSGTKKIGAVGGKAMFVARDTEGTLIWADEANKQTDYFCPVCSGKLILRAGEVNAHHFAHEAGACPDHWHYDMSDWHKTMQEQFPIECREVVMKHNGEIHRADIFKDGVVVEFQHSPITPQEFRERNTFYNTLGYKVAWVFDVSDKGIVPTIGKDGLPDYFHLYWERPAVSPALRTGSAAGQCQCLGQYLLLFRHN